MNFFKSILSDDPDPQNPSSGAGDPAGEVSGESSGWSFGGLMKTLATQSESVIEIYTRDLKEFGSGLQKEINDLPNEIDTVLKSTKEIIAKKSSTFENIENGRNFEYNDKKYSRFETLLRGLENDVNTYVSEVEDYEEFEKWKLGFGGEKEGNERVMGFYEKLVPGKVSEEEFWGRYNFRVYKLRQQEEMRERIVKRVISGDDDDEELTWDVDDEEDDSNGNGDDDNDEIKGSKVIKSGEMGKKDVLSDEKNDEKEIKEKDGVLSGEKSFGKEMKGKDEVLSDEKGIEANEKKIVESKGEEKVLSEKSVDETYMYGKEKVMNDEKVAEVGMKGIEKVMNEEKIDGVETKGKEKVSSEEKVVEAETKGKEEKIVETGPKGNERVPNEKIVEADTKKEEKVMNEKTVDADAKGKEKVSSEEKIVKVDNKGKDGDVSIVEEDDMGWDEIEDVDSGDEKKVVGISGSQDKVDLRKRLSVAEDDEDLSWDIEDDDDEPVAKPSVK